MSLKVCVLGSGSSGNCTYVASEATRVLVDAGLSCREIGRRLQLIRADLQDINAVCVSHKHADHRSGLGVLHRRTSALLYGNAGTVDAIGRDERLAGLPWRIFTNGSPFEVGDIRVEPFSVPHDSYDPVGFVMSSGESRVGIVTDMGMPTELIRERLRDCGTLIVEANHDEQMLKNASRPWSLKQRIGGRQGHLSNEQAAQLLAEVAGPSLRTVLLAHLSSDCNEPGLAVQTVRSALAKHGHTHIDVRLTYPDRPTDVIDSAA